MRAYIALALLLCATACDSIDETCEECGGPDASPRNEQASGGGDRDPCADAEADAAVLAWEAESEVGSAADAFGAAEGSCEAELQWNGAPFDDRTIEPLEGQSPVTVELVLDHDSARWVERTMRSGLAGICGGYLEAEGHVTLETADGTFRAESDVTLQRSSSGQFVTYRFDEDLQDHEGSLAIELRDNEQGSLTYEFDGSGTACAGAIALNVSSSSNGVGMAARGELAHWSDSSCPLGQAPFDLTEPLPDGSTLAETIESVWGDGTYPGTWLDGQDAELSLHVEVSGLACRALDQRGEVNVPVRVTYSTSDGRLQERTVDASVAALLNEDGSVRQLDFWLSDDLVCESESDSLEYAPADCAEIENVTVQLGFNDYRDGAGPQANGEGLTVYFAPRGGGEPPPNDHLEL